MTAEMLMHDMLILMSSTCSQEIYEYVLGMLPPLKVPAVVAGQQGQGAGLLGNGEGGAVSGGSILHPPTRILQSHFFREGPSKAWHA